MQKYRLADHICITRNVMRSVCLARSEIASMTNRPIRYRSPEECSCTRSDNERRRNVSSRNIYSICTHMIQCTKATLMSNKISRKAQKWHEAIWEMRVAYFGSGALGISHDNELRFRLGSDWLMLKVSYKLRCFSVN